jgi:DNA-directed RNA polymerase specialized sigma24 family protein
VHREQSATIQALLGRLAPRNRAAIVLRYWYDLSYEEIAAITGATASAVKSRLHRARETLGAMLRSREMTAAPSGENRRYNNVSLTQQTPVFIG